MPPRSGVPTTAAIVTENGGGAKLCCSSPAAISSLVPFWQQIAIGDTVRRDYSCVTVNCVTRAGNACNSRGAESHGSGAQRHGSEMQDLLAAIIACTISAQPTRIALLIAQRALERFYRKITTRRDRACLLQRLRYRADFRS